MQLVHHLILVNHSCHPRLRLWPRVQIEVNRAGRVKLTTSAQVSDGDLVAAKEVCLAEALFNQLERELESAHMLSQLLFAVGLLCDQWCEQLLEGVGSNTLPEQVVVLV